MSKSPLLDFKKFDHVSSTKDHTILKHKDGHTLKIAHKSLGPDFQKQLEAMSSLPKNKIQEVHQKPKHMAEGGVASKDTDTSSKESEMSDEELMNELDVLGQSKPASEELIKRTKSHSATPEAKGGRVKMAAGGVSGSDSTDAPPRDKQDQSPTPKEKTDQDNAPMSTQMGREFSKEFLPFIKGFQALHALGNKIIDSGVETGRGVVQGAKEEYQKEFPGSDQASQSAPELTTPVTPSPDTMGAQADKNVQENQDFTKQMAANQPTDVSPAAAPTKDGGGVPSVPQSVLSPGVIPQYKNSTDAALQVAEKATPQQTFANMTQEEKNNFNQQKMAWENDLVNGHITPKTYSDLFASKSTLGKIGSIFGMLIGGAGSGLARQPNIAYSMIQNELDKDFEAQKQSKNNAQNYLRIMQQDSQNKAQNARMTTENAVQALGLARVHANDAVLHSLIMERDKFPVGSAQWKNADQGLAMMYPMFQQSASKAGDMVAGAKSYYRMIQGNAMGDDPASQIRKKQMVGIITPEQSKEALKELGQNENHITVNRNVLDSFDQVQKMSNAGSFAESPIQNQARIDAVWNPMMDKLTKDTEGRVTPVTIDMMNHLKPNWKDDNKTTMMKRDQLIKTLTGSLATPTLDAIGIKVHKGEMPGETREINGKVYRKNPATGGWRPVTQ